DRGVGPALVGVEAVTAVLPADESHEVVEDQALEELRELRRVEVPAGQQQLLGVAVRLLLDGDQPEELLFAQAMNLAQEGEQRVLARDAGTACGDDLPLDHEDRCPLGVPLHGETAGLLLAAEKLQDLGNREVAEVALERHAWSLRPPGRADDPASRPWR